MCSPSLQRKMLTKDILLRPGPNCGEKKEKWSYWAGGHLMEKPLRHFILKDDPDCLWVVKRPDNGWSGSTKRNIIFPKYAQQPGHKEKQITTTKQIFGQETFCPATYRPRTYIVPGQYVAGTICRPMSPLFCCSKGRHIVPGDILSRFGKATYCPGRRIVPVGNKW